LLFYFHYPENQLNKNGTFTAIFFSQDLNSNIFFIFDAFCHISSSFSAFGEILNWILNG